MDLRDGGPELGRMYFVNYAVTASAELLGDLVVEILEVGEVGFYFVVFLVLADLLGVSTLLFFAFHWDD